MRMQREAHFHTAENEHVLCKQLMAEVLMICILVMQLHCGSATKDLESPVYDSTSGDQHFFCPENGPLVGVLYTVNNNLDNFTIEFKCAETNDTDMYEDCGTSLLNEKGIENRIIKCPDKCFVSGVQIHDGMISMFYCSNTTEEASVLTNCSFTSIESFSERYYLTNSSDAVITGLKGIYSIGKLGYSWYIEMCSMSKLLCSIQELEANIGEFYAHQVSPGFWKFSCMYGYQLQGPRDFNCNGTNKNNTTAVLQNNCKACCGHLDVHGVVFNCSEDGLTEARCEKGKVWNGIKTFCSSELSEVANLFNCEECSKLIKYCTACEIVGEKVLCNECGEHESGYSTLLTKNRRKCKLPATIKSLQYSRTDIYHWTVYCNVIGSPKIALSWYLNGTEQYSFTNEKKMPVLILSFSPYEVNCTAYNKWGYDQQNLSLALQPIAFDKIMIYIMVPGSSKLLDCVISGDVDFWHWLRNGKTIEPGTPGYILYSNTSLEIRNASATLHTGMYRCKANNIFQKLSHDKTIYVSDSGIYKTGEVVDNYTTYDNATGVPAAIINWRSSYQAYVGSSIVLNCMAIGTPMPIIAWSRNGRFIVATGVMEGYELCNETSINFYNLTVADTGDYECSVGNIHGIDSKIAHLEIIEPMLTSSLSPTGSSLVLSSSVSLSKPLSSETTPTPSRSALVSDTHSTITTLPTLLGTPTTPTQWSLVSHGNAILLLLLLTYIIVILITSLLCLLHVLSQRL